MWPVGGWAGGLPENQPHPVRLSSKTSHDGKEVKASVAHIRRVWVWSNPPEGLETIACQGPGKSSLAAAFPIVKSIRSAKPLSRQ